MDRRRSRPAATGRSTLESPTPGPRRRLVAGARTGSGAPGHGPPERRPIALSGTPGTGKTSVAARLPPSLSPVEVGEWAVAVGAGRRSRGGVTVDLPLLGHRFAAFHRRDPHMVYVGHLAHLLPIPDVVVLRCHPIELGRRLDAAGRGEPAERAENVAAEALDVILLESLALGRRVWEVDTTGRSPDSVARTVLRRATHGGAPRYGRTRWLGDPAVTAHLLERTP